MRKREPTCWRTIWATALVVGAVNAGLAAYYWFLPIQHFQKSDSAGRLIPDWLIEMTFAIDLPGIILSVPIVVATGCESEAIQITLAQVSAAQAGRYGSTNDKGF